MLAASSLLWTVPPFASGHPPMEVTCYLALRWSVTLLTCIDQLINHAGAAPRIESSYGALLVLVQIYSHKHTDADEHTEAQTDTRMRIQTHRHTHAHKHTQTHTHLG